MKKILIIDIETTGFLEKGGHIVEVGIVELDLDTGETIILYDQLVRENSMTYNELFDSWIVENSDLKVNQVMNAKLFVQEKPNIQAIIDAYELGATAFNNVFDFGFLEAKGLKFHTKLGCPMLLSTDICKLPGKYNAFKWPKVEEAWSHFFPNTPYVEKHRGADDAQHEALIVYELYKMDIFKLP